MLVVDAIIFGICFYLLVISFGLIFTANDAVENKGLYSLFCGFIFIFVTSVSFLLAAWRFPGILEMVK